MQKASPEKEFIIVPTDETCSCNDCPYMKMNTMPKLYACMKNEKPQITIDQDLIEKSVKPIERMLDISRKEGII
jgi:quinolinate synthase